MPPPALVSAPHRSCGHPRSHRTTRSPETLGRLLCDAGRSRRLLVGAARPLARRQLRQEPVVLLHDLVHRAHERRRVRARRARLHARLRHPRADQLRARRRVHARRPDLRNDDHLGVPSRRPSRDRHHDRRGPRVAPRRDGLLRRDQRVGGAHRLPAVAQRAAARAADHRDRYVVHPPGRRAALEGPVVHVGAEHPAARECLLVRRRELHVGEADRRHDHGARAARADVARAAHAARQGDARDGAGSRRRGDDGHRRQPDDLVHVHDRRRARRRRRASLRALLQRGALRHRLPARADRVHRRRARRDREPARRRARRAVHRLHPGVQRRACAGTRPGATGRSRSSSRSSS